ncbi:hypothetical protein AB1L05_13910 [Cytobacillus horneckiae]
MHQKWLKKLSKGVKKATKKATTKIKQSPIKKVSSKVNKKPKTVAAKPKRNTVVTRVEKAKVIKASKGSPKGGSSTAGKSPSSAKKSSSSNKQIMEDDAGEAVGDTSIDNLYGFKKGITPDEIRSINKSFGGNIEVNGNISTSLENASRYGSFWGKTASITRSIVGNHTFDNGNKRTALHVIKELQSRNNISTGESDSQMRGVIYQISTGKLKEVEDIARALRGF